MITSLAIATFTLLGPGAGSTSPHITPVVNLVPRAQAVRQILEGSAKFFLREVDLTSAQASDLKTLVSWTPEDRTVRFYVGRDDQGAEVGSVVLMKVDSRHGPIALAVGFDRQGTVTRVIVTQVTEETVPWVKNVLDAGLMNEFPGRSGATVQGAYDEVKDKVRPMPRYMGRIITRGVQRAAALNEVAYNS